jgi:hypothetical protein
MIRTRSHHAKADAESSLLAAERAASKIAVIS